MSTGETPRLRPPHGQWFADLFKTPDQISKGDVDDDLLAIDEHVLDLSRADTRLRGGLLGLVVFGACGLLFIVFLVANHLLSIIRDEPVGLALLLVVLLGGCTFFGYCIRLELSIPRDEPIRFNRNTGKVYVNGFKHTSNPFGKWGAEVKVYNWADLHGELIRYVQFNSRFLVIRYGLELAACKPGTLDVVDRFWIERNAPFAQTLGSKWIYICAYMIGTPLDQLPSARPRDLRVSWENSFKTWLPWLHDWRRYLEHPVLTFMALLMLPFTPLFLVFAMAHYVAMRSSPPVSWPADIDRESRRAV